MQFVSDVSETEFPTAVLERSKQVPVVVDFWAGWCAPCRMLGPTLEREVSALGGRVELAKVDVDQAQALSQRFDVRGIPAVMAFRDGQVVAEFTGARDAGFVKAWLAELSPSAAKQALAVANDEASLRALVGTEVGAAASLRLGELLLRGGRVNDALAALGAVPPSAAEYEQAQALSRLAGFAADVESFGGEEKARAALAMDAGNHEARWAVACAHAVAGRDAQALEEFLELVRRSRKFRDDGARKAMLVLFERLGAQAEVTRDFRRRLQTVL
ncbi:MAG: tetratricopeptide repeat protein [Myxococcaceae bacterium]